MSPVYSACSTMTHQFSQASACYSIRSLSFEGQINSLDLGKVLCFKFNLGNIYLRPFTALNSMFSQLY